MRGRKGMLGYSCSCHSRSLPGIKLRQTEFRVRHRRTLYFQNKKFGIENKYRKENMPVNITLPDGSQRSFAQAVTVADVALSIGAGLARAALAGKIDGRLVDTSHLIAQDAAVAIITDKDAEGVEIIRHSTAHLLAYAVKELFPDAQVTIGPVIENGFFYDFSYHRPFTPEDLAAIEKRMTELAKQDIPVSRKVLPRDEAVSYFKGINEHYKAEIIASIPADQEVSLYT